MSVDPFIQGVTSQAINPYSYIGNNPLSGTDPSGYRSICGTDGKGACSQVIDYTGRNGHIRSDSAGGNGIKEINIYKNSNGVVVEIETITNSGRKFQDSGIQEFKNGAIGYLSSTDRLVYLLANNSNMLDLQANAGPDMRVNQYIAHRMAEKNGTDFKTEYDNLNVWGEINIDGEDLYQFGVGFGDGVTFGLTAKMREWSDIDGGVDTSSFSYNGGFVVGGTVGSANAVNLTARFASRGSISGGMATVTRWHPANRGRVIRSGDWVMMGQGSRLNWFLSGTAAPSFFNGRFRAAYKLTDSVSDVIPLSRIQLPGWGNGRWRAIFGQRKIK